MPYKLQSDNTTNVVKPTLLKILQKKKDTPLKRKQEQEKAQRAYIERITYQPQLRLGRGRSDYDVSVQRLNELRAQQMLEAERLARAEEEAKGVAMALISPLFPSRHIGNLLDPNVTDVGSYVKGLYNPHNKGIYNINLATRGYADRNHGEAVAFNLGLDIASPFLIGKTASVMPKVGFQQGGLRIGNSVYRASRGQLNMGVPLPERVPANDITENFLKFVGSNGKPLLPAIPKTLAQTQLYAMLKANGVDMSKISLSDINRALQLREQLLISSGKQFSYLQPVTSNSEIIWSIDNGMKTGYIDLRMPYQVNDRGFNPTYWENYINNPKNRGLRVGMVENMTLTKPLQYPFQIRGLLERLTNSAIDVAKLQGYDGVISGEALLSPEKTVKMYPRYKDKSILSEDGSYHWERHNPNLTELPGTIYMLKSPTYRTEIKSQLFNPKIIDQNGKMHITWGKGSTMFNGIVLPFTLATIFGNSE